VVKGKVNYAAKKLAYLVIDFAVFLSFNKKILIGMIIFSLYNRKIAYFKKSNIFKIGING